MKPSCLIVAGEPSGEEHALTFLPELMKSRPDVQFFGVGGDRMKKLGVEILYHVNDFSSWGFTDVALKIFFYIKALKRLAEECKRREVQTAILIDFQGFNFKLSKKLKLMGVDILYYVAPQAWAWKEWRAFALGKLVHTLFTLIPFEREWFKQRGVQRVVGIPHPLLQQWRQQVMLRPRNEFSRETTIKIVLLPGSRNTEVEHMLSTFVDAVTLLKKSYRLDVTLVKSNNANSELFTPYLNVFQNVVREEDIDKALSQAHLAIASSGTVTLTCALFQVPTVVCYKVSWINEFFVRTILHYSGFQGPFSLANIFHQEWLYPELMQNECNSFEISQLLRHWIENKQSFQDLVRKLETTKELLTGTTHHPSHEMLEVLNKNYG